MRRERDAMPNVGAQFSLSESGEEMFSFVIDGGSIIGPRPATDEDREKHAEAYAEFRGGPVTPEMFGAKGDGVTDDTAAVQAALDAAVGAIETGPGDYVVGPLDGERRRPGRPRKA